jgi:hypothetical protein
VPSSSFEKEFKFNNDKTSLPIIVVNNLRSLELSFYRRDCYDRLFLPSAHGMLIAKMAQLLKGMSRVLFHLGFID